jgi:trans-L-3-hydroxyproline dehydratase
MHLQRTYTTIDAHTAGEPLRIVTAGIPRIPGASMLEKRRWVKTNLDEVRQALIWEPRGHADMYGAYLTEPVTQDADFGVIFMHNEGYSDMCGHGIIALASVIVHQGLVAPRIPETRVGFDTPAGLVEAFVAWDGATVGEVRFVNVPSFVYRQGVTVTTPSFGELTVDIAFGGAFYAYLEADDLPIDITPRYLRELIQLGDELKRAVIETTPIAHPLIPELNQLYGAIISQWRDERHQANVCIFAEREVDRSPTGTGTAGRLAQLFARGALRQGELLVNESIIGTRFGGKVIAATTVGDYSAVVPEVSGRAFITGFNQLVIDIDDPLASGFFLR